MIVFRACFSKACNTFGSVESLSLTGVVVEIEIALAPLDKDNVDPDDVLVLFSLFAFIAGSKTKKRYRNRSLAEGRF